MPLNNPRPYRHTVLLQRSPDVVGSQGGANPSPSGSPVTLLANVQLEEADIVDVEEAGATIPRTVRRAAVFFPTNPGCKRGDSLAWGGWTFNVKGPAEDTGYGQAFWVDCEAVT